MADTVLARCRDYQTLRTGRVAVGAGPYPLETSIVECVARLAARHPLLQVEVLEGQWRDFGSKLLSGDIEMAVVEATIVAADPRFQFEPLPSHQGFFYCRPGHPLAGRPQVTIPEVLDHPLVGVRMPARVLPRTRADSPGFSVDPFTGDLVPRITTTSIAASRAIVKRTDGIGIAVSEQIAEDLRRGELITLNARVKTLRTAYGIVHLRDRSLSPGAHAFAATLREVEAKIGGSPG